MHTHPSNRQVRNLAANLAGRAWSLLSVWAFTPLYIRLLGSEHYGIIAFYNALQSFLILADAGMSPAVNREIATRAARSARPSEMRALVSTLERVCTVTTAALIAVMFAAAPWIAASFLGRSGLGNADSVTAVRLMGLAVALQLFSSLHSGVLLGLQRHVRLNATTLAAGIVRSAGTLAALYIRPDALTYLAGQATANLLMALALAALVHRALPRAADRGARVSIAELRGLLPYAAGAAAISVTGTLLMQADKFVIAKVLGVQALTYYALAFTAASLATSISGPIATTLLPRFTELMARGQHDRLANLYHRASQLVAVLVYPANAVLAAFGTTLMSAWLHNPDAGRKTGEWIGPLSLGFAAMSTTAVPFALELAAGWTSLPLVVNSVSALTLTPALVLLVSRQGERGAVWTFLLLNGIYMLVHMPLMYRRLLPDEKWRWCVKDVLFPAAAAITVVFTGKVLIGHVRTGLLLPLVLTGFVWLAAMAASILVCPDLRRTIWRGLQSLFLKNAATYSSGRTAGAGDSRLIYRNWELRQRLTR